MFKLLKQQFYSAVGLAAIAGILLAAILFISWMRPWRIDLTQNNLYTLSPGTLSLLEKHQGEPLRLTFYYSDKVTQDIPSLRAYAKRVRETLEEYELQSKGKILLNIVDPEPFSEAEDQAASFGLQGIPAGNNDTIYFGLIGEHTVGGETDEVKRDLIAFFDPQKENSLEYDISQLLYRLQRNKPVVVGVISDIPIFQHRDMRSGQVNAPKVIMEQLRQMFDVRRVYDTTVTEIDEEIDLLMVVHPHLWSASTLYAIDQFVLRGGRLLAFMDPKAEMDKSEKMLFGSSGDENKSSSLDELLTAWGVQYDPDKILLDYQFAHTIPVTQYGQALPHVGVLGIRDEGFNREEAMTASTDQVNLATTGVMSALPDATTQFISLMKSSTNTQLLSVEDYDRASNHEELLRQFVSDGKGPYTLSAYISGPVKTAFPQGKPVAPDDGDQKKDKNSDEAHLAESREDISVVLFADTDILDDRMWVQVDDFYGQLVARPWASNSDLILNVLEKLAGSADLINVRSRGTYNRPFDRVSELQRAASDKLRLEEEALRQKLAETEERLMALNSDGAVTETGEAIALTPEQQQEVDKFQQERLQIRKRLREVQHQLNKDIEQLGSTLKILNMLAIPVLLAIFLLVLTGLRRRAANAQPKG
jgi:ABC-type uncharacterized transport system involved in gliding motility auxiliary subunit